MSSHFVVHLMYFSSEYLTSTGYIPEDLRYVTLHDALSCVLCSDHTHGQDSEPHR